MDSAAALVALRSRKRHWAYMGILCIESFVGFWGAAEVGLPGAYRSTAVSLWLLIQFLWPTFLLWLALFAFYLSGFWEPLQRHASPIITSGSCST